MRVRLKAGLIVLTADEGDEQAKLAAWSAEAAGHVFLLVTQDDGLTVRLRDLGPQGEATNEPINILATSPDPVLSLISNLAHTPFELHGASYASVEGFWQGLKFPDVENRAQLATLYGMEAKEAGETAPAAETLQYNGARVRIGTHEHWALMYAACWAKFSTHDAAQQALLATGTRPLTHRVRRDSLTIPGVVMADIWLRIRARLRRAATGDTKRAAPDE